MHRRAISLSAILVLAAGAALGDSTGAVHERAGVTIIEVPVTVIDHEGKPVRGLTAADFDVRDDGKPVTVQGVDVTEFPKAKEAAPAAAQAPSPVVAAARRRFLLLFDLSFSTPSRVKRIREAARKFVTEQIGPNDLVAVATYSLEHGFNLVVTFTPDRPQLAWAVETLGSENAAEKPADPLQMMAQVPNEWAVGGNDPSQQQPSTGKNGDAILDNMRDFARAYKRSDDAYRRGRVTQLLQSFGSLARALDAVEGRKQVIYFSQGFDIRLLQGNSQDTAQTIEQNENAAHGATWTIDSQARFGSSSLQSQLNDVLAMFQRSDCVIHTVDLSGITAGSADESDPSNGAGQASLFAMADGTGGQLFRNANDFAEQLDQLLDAESVVYVLAFSPKLTGHPDRFHTLKVKVDRPSVRVSARAGYYEPKPFATATLAEKNLTAADVIASEIPVHDVPVTVSAQPFAGKGTPTVMMQIQVPASALSAPNGKLPIEVYGYAFDASGKIADFSVEKATVDLATVKTKLDAAGLRYFAQLRLPPGRYRLRALVRAGDAGAMGFAATDVVVPDFASHTPFLVEPLAVGAGEGLILRGKSARGGTEGDFPYMAGADPFLPESHPAASAGKPLKLCVFTYAMGEPAQVRIGGEVLDSAGKPVGPANLSLVGHTSADDLGKATYLLAWNPEGIQPGQYRLRIMVQDPASGAARQASTAVEVR